MCYNCNSIENYIRDKPKKIQCCTTHQLKLPHDILLSIVYSTPWNHEAINGFTTIRAVSRNTRTQYNTYMLKDNLFHSLQQY